jgi:hypothetical protein
MLSRAGERESGAALPAPEVAGPSGFRHYPAVGAKPEKRQERVTV